MITLLAADLGLISGPATDILCDLGQVTYILSESWISTAKYYFLSPQDFLSLIKIQVSWDKGCLYNGVCAGPNVMGLQFWLGH